MLLKDRMQLQKPEKLHVFVYAASTLNTTVAIKTIVSVKWR